MAILTRDLSVLSKPRSFLSGPGQWRAIFLIIGSLGILSLVSICTVIWFLSHSNSEEMQRDDKAVRQQLERNVSEISEFKPAVLIQHNALVKAGRGHVSKAYRTSVDYEIVKRHYDSELKKHGWFYVREENIIYDGHDYGGKRIVYCKAMKVASLQYAGRQEKQFGWTYSFAVSVGLFKECS